MSQTKTELKTDGKPAKLRGSRLVAAIVVTLLVFAGTMSMALVAISVQTGYFRAALPSTIQKVQLLLIDRTVEVATYAPLALEVGQWLLTLMVVVLVFCRLPYGRWHRAMWAIGLSVAAVNGWHIYEITTSASIGASFGAFSILGPALVHLYVLFMRQLIAGRAVTEALGETAGGLITAVRSLVRGLRFVLGAVLHPRRSFAYVSQWSVPPLTHELQLRQEERELELELASRLRRHALISAARQQLLNRSVAEPSLIVRLLARVPWISARFEIRRPKQGVTGLGTRTLAREHAAEPTLPVHPAGRTDTTLPLADESRSGGVLTAVSDPSHDGPHSVHGPVREGVTHDVAVRTFQAELADDERLHGEIDQLARRYRVSGAHGVQHDVHGDTEPHAPVVRDEPVDSVQDERADTVRPAPSVQVDRANERANVATSINESVRGDSQGVREGSHGGVQSDSTAVQATVQSDRAAHLPAGDSAQDERVTRQEASVQAGDGVQSGRAWTVGEQRAEASHTVREGVREGVQDGLHGDRVASVQDDDELHDGADTPEDTGTFTKKALIVEHYYRLLDANEDVANMNRADITRELRELAPTLDASTVRRYWNQCLKGICPRPVGVAAAHGTTPTTGHGRTEQ